MELSDRKKKILASVVEKYIMTGEPVGSKVICGNLLVSSATVRNEMSFLSEFGYLEQPHTSSGRIPSQKGLRYYVDKLMPSCDISDVERFMIESRFNNFAGEPDDIIKEAAKLLSEMTSCAAAALTPYDSNAVIKRAELVPLSQKSALVVVLVSTGVLKSRICRCDTELDYNTAELFYNIAAAQFIGKRSEDFTPAVLQSIAAPLGDKAFVMIPLLFTLCELAKEASRCSVITEGQSKLLSYKSLEPYVYDIFECIKRSSDISRLLNAGHSDLNVTIGRECMNRALENTSVISAKYSVGGKNVGSIGVIGPIFMDYSVIIPSINFISKTVGKVLSEVIDE